ncbi:MAG: hypothetical protein IPK50_18025 [Fibrobacterota bacterium]|nr:MAG: hypothetical protein IPK50_18025 [Fibrobacterota bacterium]
MRFLPALLCLATTIVAADPFDPKGTTSTVAGLVDSTPKPDSAATKPVAKSPTPKVPYRAPEWSWEVSPRAGALAANFPERSNFANDIARSAQAETLSVQQPYPGSDIAVRVGADFSVRKSNAFRFLIGTDWTHWGAEAIARRDSTGRMVNRAYSSDLYMGSVGLDLLISPSILSVDAARDAFLGFRYRAGAGRLIGRQTAWGFSSGTAFLLGADFAAWQKLALSGMLGWNSQTTQTDQAWSEILWNSPTKSTTSWSAGGLSVEFVLRWGPSRDTNSVQKK